MHKTLNRLMRGEALTNPTSHSPVNLQNRVRIRVVDQYGNTKSEQVHVGNIMTAGGLSYIAELAATDVTGFKTSLVKQAIIGTGSTAESSSHTALVASTGSAISNNSTNFAVSYLGGQTTEYRLTFLSSNPAGTATLQEIGLFYSSNTSNQMLCRKLLSPTVSKGANDSILCSYQLVWKTSA